MQILIKNIGYNNTKKDIFIDGDRFEKIAEHIDRPADKIINGKDMKILPAFYNLHTHAAMTLLRGYSEDLPLMPWLEKIWAREATLTPDDIYNGTRLAILEMIKSGTVFFADMYFMEKEVLRAVEEMHIRSNIGITFMDRLGEKEIENKLSLLDDYASYNNPLVSFSPMPHAIYTCSGELYKRCYTSAKKNNLYFQTHIAETSVEVNDCKKNHSGRTPIEYLDSIGVLDEKTSLAHCVYLTDNDADIIAQRQSIAVHNPCSNMKLSSGVFDIPKAKRFGMKIALGTDGCSSNNNLNMMEEMKFAALLCKVTTMQSESLTAEQVYKMATINGAKAYGIDAGEILEGKLADCILVNMNNERLQPDYNTVYNIVYSADSSCIDTVICAGRVIMEHHHVENEEEIISKAKQSATKN